MSDKVQLIKEEIKKRISQCYRLLAQDLLERERNETTCCLQQYKELIQFIDLLSKEPTSEDERIKKAIKKALQVRCDGSRIISDEPVTLEEAIAWLEKQGEVVVDKELSDLLNKVICHFINEPNIPYSERDEVSKKIIPYVKELEKQGEQKSYSWKPTKEQFEALDYAYNSCSDTERGNYYEGVLETLIEDLHRLEKQGEQKEYTFKSLPRLLDMIEPTSKAKAYCQKLIDTLVNEGYATDAKIVGECLKQMNGEKVALATMDEKQSEQKIAAKYKVGDTVYTIHSEDITNIVEDGTDNPMYEDKEGNAVFEKDLIKQKPAWSERDEKYVKDLADYFTGGLSLKHAEEDIADWLKSLKERYTWRPSERQKEALLWCVVHLGGADKQALGELLEELNKL